MKEILFRAKRKSNSEWVEGYYAKAKDFNTEKEIHIIFPLTLTKLSRNDLSAYYEIIPESLEKQQVSNDVESYQEDLRTRIEELINEYKKTGSIAQIEACVEIMSML